MAVDEMQALNTILFNRLAGHVLWDDRVYPVGLAPALVVRPYVLFFWAGGGADNMAVNKRNARIVMTVKGVAEELDTALSVKAAIEALLADTGTQDTQAALNDLGGWEITTVTQDRTVYVEEALEGTQRVYHAGNQYIITMERS